MSVKAIKEWNLGMTTDENRYYATVKVEGKHLRHFHAFEFSEQVWVFLRKIAETRSIDTKFWTDMNPIDESAREKCDSCGKTIGPKEADIWSDTLVICNDCNDCAECVNPEEDAHRDYWKSKYEAM